MIEFIWWNDFKYWFWWTLCIAYKYWPLDYRFDGCSVLLINNRFQNIDLVLFIDCLILLWFLHSTIRFSQFHWYLESVSIQNHSQEEKNTLANNGYKQCGLHKFANVGSLFYICSRRRSVARNPALLVAGGVVCKHGTLWCSIK